MHPRNPHPRWARPMQPWMQPPAWGPGRPVFVSPMPPRPHVFAGPPGFFPPPLRPPIGFYPRFVPPPPRPPAIDSEQLWMDNFKRTHCNPVEKSDPDEDTSAEPPLRILRRRVMQVQKLTEQLKAAAAELAVVEKRLGMVCGDIQESEKVTASVETQRLRAQRERKLAVCELLKTELEEMNAAVGMFPEKQLADIRAFAARVQKKKAYRKRAKQRRRAEASIRRAVELNTLEKGKHIGDESGTSTTEESGEYKEAPDEKVCPSPNMRILAPHSSAPGRKSPNQSLHPETLTIDTLITVRRAWDAYIVIPQTMGASTIPPHFVPPPPTPTAQWAVYAVANSSTVN